MKRYYINVPLIASVLLIVVLLFIIGLQHTKICGYEKKLSNLCFVDWKADSLFISNGLEKKLPNLLLTPLVLTRSLQYSSPFGDSRSLAELMSDEIHSSWQDIYGCARRTDNIKRIHEGIDFFVPKHTVVYPIAPIGIVTEVEPDSHYCMQVSGINEKGDTDSVFVEYGKIVRILYPEGIETIYAHLDDIFVTEGTVVYATTPIGITGYTGNIRESGKASHLHMELRTLDNCSFDPELRLHFTKSNFTKFFNTLCL